MDRRVWAPFLKGLPAKVNDAVFSGPQTPTLGTTPGGVIG